MESESLQLLNSKSFLTANLKLSIKDNMSVKIIGCTDKDLTFKCQDGCGIKDNRSKDCKKLNFEMMFLYNGNSNLLMDNTLIIK